ncbi:hypothetical protein, unlikely [Trypanosoma brucei brucei TREU927]|uniref:Secreted protein n=1 Tax=Trypanosoma brucei brucei (strain 927/4 GUTat10.1) TaxID=185431 RepID=Q38F92_TRYB2|nr:hypothetical protein, unlikely [Trypanosoma brucei brucei TREU927]EAN76528.1 hypothetical protein, unlikely [Trypanosoma brucei brucei TREU927]
MFPNLFFGHLLFVPASSHLFPVICKHTHTQKKSEKREGFNNDSLAVMKSKDAKKKHCNWRWAAWVEYRVFLKYVKQ